MKAPGIIAEIGCNHRGDIDTAKEMVQIAALFCKVDVVKFQKRCPKELLTPERYNSPHPNPNHSYGETYGLHREALELSLEQHAELKEVCERFGVAYSCSVWDLTSARDILSLEPSIVKIPSACNTNTPLLELLAKHHYGEIHVSLGMTTRGEEDQLITLFEALGRSRDVVVYSCISGYPVAFDDLCLLEITRLNERYAHRVKGIGFSGHHLGIAADIAAITLGAQWVERHFTLDRTWKGTDHAASLEPDGLRRLTRDVRNVHRALQHKATEVLPIETVQRAKLKWVAR
jgi:sialic acid synthase